MSRVASGLVVLLILLGAAAGGDTTGTGVATLTTRLEAVDAAAVVDAHADRIRTAAEALLEASAPAERRSPTAPTEPTESTSTSPPPDEDKGKSQGKGKAKGHDKDD